MWYVTTAVLNKAFEGAIATNIFDGEYLNSRYGGSRQIVPGKNILSSTVLVL